LITAALPAGADDADDHRIKLRRFTYNVILTFSKWAVYLSIFCVAFDRHRQGRFAAEETIDERARETVRFPR
jgi:hypothetical protein